MLDVTRPAGLASTSADELGAAIVSAWDDFLVVLDGADLTRPSRLKGLSRRDLLVHLGTWDDHLVLEGLVGAAASGSDAAAVDPEQLNRSLLARRRDATEADVRAALERSRTEVAGWFATSGPAELGRVPVSSAVGRIPLLTVLHAGCYELAVHALDLRADRPSDALLDRGLAALVDVTGGLAHQHGIRMSLTAQAPEGGWSFVTSPDGWETTRASGSFDGPGVRGDAAVLLDASAGRASLPALLTRRKLKVQDMTGFLRLAPMIDAVPGLPGGPVLRAGVKALSRLVR